jgi:hypothetical protein
MRALATVVAAAAMLAVAVAGPGLAGVSAAQAPGDPAPVRGELLSVDLDARTISVRSDDGLTWQFLFTDDTVVNGAGEGTAGLATLRGVTVTVAYTTEASAFVARVIDVASEG